jgi:hypothetical protein
VPLNLLKVNGKITLKAVNASAVSTCFSLRTLRLCGESKFFGFLFFAFRTQMFLPDISFSAFLLTKPQVFSVTSASLW